MKLQVTVHDHKLHFRKLYGEHNQCSLEIMSNDYLLVIQTCHYCIAGASPDDMMPYLQALMTLMSCMLHNVIRHLSS